MRSSTPAFLSSASTPLLSRSTIPSFQGEMVAEILADHNRAYEPAAVPAIVFTEPEVVSVGL